MDYSFLSSAEEFEYQKKVLRIYVETSNKYSNYFAAMVPDLQERLSVLGAENPYAKGAIKAAIRQNAQQQPIVESLMQAHAEYGSNMIRLLELLQANKEQWRYRDNELIFNDESLFNDHEKLLKELSANESVVNTLSERLDAVM